MKLIIALGHPAHFHLFKTFMQRMASNGHSIKIVITDKDILKKLLDEHQLAYTTIARKKEGESFFDKIKKIFNSTLLLKKIVSSFKPDLMIGSMSQPAFISFFIKTPYLFVGEDDITYTWLQGLSTYPFVSGIFAPNPTKVGVFRYKKIAYNGYQKLAYLHPNILTPDVSKLKRVDMSKPFYLIRLVNLDAYHDGGATGFTENILDRLIDKLTTYGNIFISSEKKLNDKYKKYHLPINVKDIHHLMYYADIYIGDSQSMAVEAAVLGTPSVRFNSFAGRISVLEELENKYKLTFGIQSNDQEKLLRLIDKLLQNPDLKKNFQFQKEKMIADKIDVTAFMFWFVENYPQSKKIIKKNPDYQNTFR